MGFSVAGPESQPPNAGPRWQVSHLRSVDGEFDELMVKLIGKCLTTICLV